MSPNEADPGPGAVRRELAAVAGSALRAVPCDLVVITGVREAAGTVHASGDARVPDAALLAALSDRTADTVAGFGYQQHEAVDLRVGGDCLGVLHALGRDGAPLDRSMVAAFASHSAFTLGYGRLDRDARRTSRFDQLALATTSFAELVPRLEDAISSIVGPVLVGVSAWDEESGLLELVPGSFRSDLAVTRSRSVDPADLHSNASRVFALQRPFVTNAARGDPAVLQDYVEVFGLDSLMAVPLAVAARPTGVLVVANRPGGFRPDDLLRCEAIAPRVAVAVELTRTHRNQRFRNRADRLLSELGVEVLRTRSLPEPVDGPLGRLGRLVGAEILAVVPREPGSPPTVHLHTCRDGTAVDRLVRDARRHAGRRPSGPVVEADRGDAVHLPAGLQDPWSLVLSASRSGGRFTLDHQQVLTRVTTVLALGQAAEDMREQRVTLARLEERRRIADDLHDDVGQILFAAQIAVDSVLEASTDGAGREALQHVDALLVRASDALRESVSALAPQPLGPLTDRLLAVAREVEREWPVRVSVEIAAAPDDGIDAAVVSALLRMARECLVNAAKHAGPCRAVIRLADAGEGRLRFSVSDDGRGSADRAGPIRTADGPRRTGHGLASLHRLVSGLGGTLVLESRPGGGTRVEAEIPVSGRR